MTTEILQSPDKLADQYHNPELRKEDSVFMIWSDGKITMTKGGELYGDRSLHVMCKAIPGTDNFIWAEKFPVKIYETSYAIVTEAQAHEVHELIIDNVCHWLQFRKKIKY